MDLKEAAALELLNSIEPETLPGVAIDALVAGVESKSLLLLAGEVPALTDTAELRHLFRQALLELGLQPRDRLSAVRAIVGLWSRRLLENHCSPTEAVSILSEIVNGLPGDDEQLVLDAGFGEIVAIYDQAEDPDDAATRTELRERFACFANGGQKMTIGEPEPKFVSSWKDTDAERIRVAFGCRRPLSTFSDEEYASLKWDISSVDYATVVEWLPLLLLHELENPARMNGDALVYFLDGNKADRGRSAALLRAIARPVLESFTMPQAQAVRLWLKRVAKQKYGRLCPDDLVSALAYWTEREKQLS